VALMPVCIECASAKGDAEFYRHPQASNGLMGVCKDCHKSRMRIRARINPAVQEYDRARAKTPERRAKARAITVKWRAENPQGEKAHRAVSYAVSSGKLKKLPCEFCGSERVHAHHRDYSKPLEVVWLCAKCHHRLHAVFPELEGKAKAHV